MSEENKELVKATEIFVEKLDDNLQAELFKVMSEDVETRDRAIEMLKIAAKYIEDNCPDSVIHYDEADCDGYCVAEDCRLAAEALEPTPKDSLKPEEWW